MLFIVLRFLRYLRTKWNQPALDLERQRHELREAQLEVFIVLDKITQRLDRLEEEADGRARFSA